MSGKAKINRVVLGMMWEAKKRKIVDDVIVPVLIQMSDLSLFDTQVLIEAKADAAAPQTTGKDVSLDAMKHNQMMSKLSELFHPLPHSDNKRFKLRF